MIINGLRPIHPGEILREEFLLPLGLSVNALAKALHVPATLTHEIVKKNRGITPDTALRLAPCQLFWRLRYVFAEPANRI